MDGFGEFLGGFFDLFGERAVEAAVESRDAGTGEQAREEYVRVLAGARPTLNVNDA